MLLQELVTYDLDLFVLQELEDTIESLRSQVHSLQQRAALLQDELDAQTKYGLHLHAPLGGSVNTLASTNSLKSTS